MKCVIFGSREFSDYSALEKAVKDSGFDITEIFNGGAAGGDALGVMYGERHKIPVKDYPALWNDLNVENCKIKVNQWGKEYNVLAGFNRNQLMADDSDCGIGLQFGDTSGTKDMEDKLRKAGKPIFMVRPEIKEDDRIEF